MPSAVAHRQGLMASFLVPSLPGAPSPGGPTSTPTLSTLDYFWEPASMPAPSRNLWVQPRSKESSTGCMKGEENEGAPRG